MIDTGVVIANPERFSAGTGCALYHGAYILNEQGQFELGDDSHLGAYSYVNVVFGSVRIGRHVAIGPGTKLIAYSNHYEPGRLVTETKIQRDITVGDNVFIGANCTVLPGSVIQNDVVVGAGSVVRGTLLAGRVYAGAPVKVIREAW